MPRLPLLRLPFLLLGLAAPVLATAQTEVASWTIPSSHPAHLGQAQAGRVCVTENDVNAVRLHDTFGGVVGSFTNPPVGGNDLYAIETTDDSIVVVQPGNIGLYKFSRTGELQRAVYFGGPPAEFPGRLVPLPGGQSLVAFAGDLRIFDRFLAPVGSIPKVVRGGSPAGTMGMARRPDGSIVCCERTNLLAWRLVAYAAGGGLLWDVPIANGGPVATAADGSIYVCHGDNASSLDVYAAGGTLAYTWTGPAGSPLSSVVDLASSPAGDLLFTLTYATGGPVRVFGDLPVRGRRASWGAIKAAAR